MKKPFRLRLFALCGVLWLFAPAGHSLPAADFLRGDANSDGELSISDAYKIASDVFLFRDPPSCFMSGDFNDDGQVDFTDSVKLLSFLYLGGIGPPEPYPGVGPDPTPGGDGAELECESYGGGTPLVDPAARLEVLPAVTAGGETTSVEIRIAVSSSTSLAGFVGRLQVLGWIVGDSKKPTSPLLESGLPEFRRAGLTDDVIDFGVLLSLNQDIKIPPGESTVALELQLCINPGTDPGVYPLILDLAELVDAESGRAIHPEVVDSTLTVEAAVTGEILCNGTSPPPPPEKLNAVFQIGSASASPGSLVNLPFFIRTDGGESGGTQGYSFSVDFDEEVLEAQSVEQVWAKPDGSDYDFKIYEFNNLNDTPGNEGIDEGFLIGSVVFDHTDPVVMPPNLDNVALKFHFQIRPGTTATATEVRFLPGGRGTGQRVKNAVTAYGHSYTPEVASSFVFLSGFVNVLDDITVFIRGDSNLDNAVDLSDAQTTLSHLFLGETSLGCYDAADFNDDGTLDLSDPVATLLHLFFAGFTPLPPYPEAGEDPTSDAMGCLFRS